MKNTFLFKTLLLTAGALTSCSSPEQTQTQPEMSNFLFILVDDMGWTDAGCFGSSFYETPHLDRLAEQGMKFTNAYAACPVCSPTRASIMTGKYPVNHGITDWIPGRQKYYPKEDQFKFVSGSVNFNQNMDLEEFTIAEALKEAGYKTHFAGKWHLGKEKYYPEYQGFDFNIGGTHKGGPYGNGGYFYPFGAPGVPGEEGDFLTNKLTEFTCDFMRQNRDTCFFAYLSFYTLHNPIMAPDSLVKKYRKKAKKLGYTDEQRFDRDRDWMKQWSQAKHGDFKVRRVQDNPVYAAMVEIMDNNIGLLMKTLQDNNLDDNTIVIFTGDNGGLSTSEGSNTCNLPLRAGKGWLYEGGIREPTIIKWPGVTKPGSISGALVTSTDYYPTMLEMANLPLRPDQHIDGKSLVSVLKGNKQEDRTIFWHYPHYSNQGGEPGSAVRDGDYKLIDWFEKDSLELYNLRENIGETKNLAKENPEKTKELKTKLDNWRNTVNAKFPKPNPDYEPIQ